MRIHRYRRIRNSRLSVIAFTFLCSIQTSASADDILVAAAASLTDALKEVTAAYHAKSTHKVNFNFGASSTLARQIEEGAPVDIFFSADLVQIDNLDKNGRLE